MGTFLPGDKTGQTAIGVTKAALRLMGGTEFADLIGDLTGLGRIRIEGLVRRAEADLAVDQGHEFQSLAMADKEWCEATLLRTYARVAHQPDRALIRESLVGASAITSLVINTMSDLDRRTLTRASDDMAAYFNGLSCSAANLVSNWYQSDADANRVAVSMAVGETLDKVRQLLLRLEGTSEGRQTLRPSQATLDRQFQALTAAALQSLSQPPDYYPADFDNAGLGAALEVGELGPSDFYQFEGRGLYWDGRFRGDRLTLTAPSIAPGQIMVVLGDPGSGKTTKGRSLTLETLRAGESAAYARLEDVVDILHADPAMDPEELVVHAFARTCQLRFGPDDATALVDYWGSRSLRPLTVLDGLDELVTLPEYSAARDVAVELARRGHRVVVTSRASGYTTAWEEASSHMSIAPLSDDAVGNFLNAWFERSAGEKEKTRLLRALELREFGDVLHNPLTLGFACMLAARGEVPVARGPLFERFIDHFLRSPWRATSKRESDPARVGELTDAAETVAWAMANHRRGESVVWEDVLTLVELRRHTASAAGYAVFASGLLVPHGAVEPIGSTQQSIRWLHRAVHESLVAQSLRSKVERDDPEWKDQLFGAILRPSWQEAVRQLASLLGDGDELHKVIEWLCTAITADGDTPANGLSWGLTNLLLQECSCTATHQSVSTILSMRGDWRNAARADLQTMLPILLVAINEGRVIDQGVWSELYQSEAPEAKEVVHLAQRAGYAPDVLGHATTWYALNAGDTAVSDDDVAKLFDRSSFWHTDTLPSAGQSRLLEQAVRRLRSAVDAPRVSLDRVWNVLRDAFASSEELLSATDDPQLLLAFRLGQTRADLGHDLSAIHSQVMGPYHQADEAFLAAHLTSQGLRRAFGNPALTTLGGLECEFCFPTLRSELTHLTDCSPQLAIAILTEYSQSASPLSLNQVETLEWALTVADSVPQVGFCEPLWNLRRTLDGWHDRTDGFVDSSFLVGVIHKQPWLDLAELQRSQSQQGTHWMGLALCQGSDVILWYGTESRYREDELYGLFIEGIDLLLRPGVTKALIDDFDLPRRVPASITYRMARLTLERCRALPLDIAQAVAIRVEHSLEAAGMVPEFFKMLVDATSGDE